MDKHLRIKILGRVQGVGFRFCAHLAFVDLGLKGVAENLPDGSVLLDAQGQEEKLERLVKWCHKGPEGARVSNVEINELPLESEASASPATE